LLLLIARPQQRYAVRRLAVAETHQRLAHQVLVRVRVLLLLMLAVRAQVVAAGTGGGVPGGGAVGQSAGERKRRLQ